MSQPSAAAPSKYASAVPHPNPLPLLDVGGQMSDSFESAE